MKMESKPVTRNRGFAGWLDDFVSAFAKTATKKEAEINLDNCPKVVWNDETYYVNFDDKGATVYNEFGNEVTSLKGVMTIQDVDKALNGKQVVPNHEEPNKAASFEDSLMTALAKTTLADEFSPAGTTPDESGNAQQTTPPTTDQSLAPQAPAAPGAPQAPDATNTTPTQPQDQPLGTTAPDGETIAADDNGAKTVGDMIDSVEAASVEDDGEGEGDYIKASLAAIESQLTQIRTALEEDKDEEGQDDQKGQAGQDEGQAPGGQEYARHELSDVSYPTDGMEQNDFAPKADETMEEIKREDNVDLTTPQGRTDVFKRLVPKDEAPAGDYAEQVLEGNPGAPAEGGQAAIVPGVNEDHDPAENNKPTVEAPHADNAAEQAPAPGAITDMPKMEALQDSTEEAPKADTLEEQNTEEDKVEEDKKEPTDSATKDITEPDGGNKPQLASRVAGRDANIFKQAICVECGHKSLTLANKVASLQGVYCASCDTEYAVDLENEEIFKKN